MRKEAINLKERMMSYMGTFEEWKGKGYIYIYISLGVFDLECLEKPGN